MPALALWPAKPRRASPVEGASEPSQRRRAELLHEVVLCRRGRARRPDGGAGHQDAPAAEVVPRHAYLVAIHLPHSQAESGESRPAEAVRSAQRPCSSLNLSSDVLAGNKAGPDAGSRISARMRPVFMGNLNSGSSHSDLDHEPGQPHPRWFSCAVGLG